MFLIQYDWFSESHCSVLVWGGLVAPMEDNVGEETPQESQERSLLKKILSYDLSFKGRKPLPKPPSSIRSIAGPGVIMAAMAIGAGELIFWPVLVTKTGPGLLWLIPIALIVQFVWLIESTRWTVVTGEGWIQATGRLPGRGLWPGLWLTVMTISLIWPGWSVAAAAGFWVLTGGPESPLDLRAWGLIVYLVSITALLVPRYVFQGLFLASSISLLVFNAGLIIAFIAVVANEPGSLGPVLKGYLSVGSVPENVDFPLLASAIAWAGLGAMGNAFYSLLVRDRGFGMAAHVGRIPGLTGKEVTVAEKGYLPEEGDVKEGRLTRWIRLMEKDALYFFLIPSILSLFIFTYLAATLLHPAYVAGEITDKQLARIGAVIVQSKFFEYFMGNAGVVMYLIVAVFALWSTQIGLLDAMARTWVDTLYVYSGRVRSLGIKKTYTIALLAFAAVGLTVILSGKFQQTPLTLLKLGAILGLIQQVISMPITIMINNRLLPPEMRRAANVRLVFSGVLVLGMFLYLISLINAVK